MPYAAFPASKHPQALVPLQLTFTSEIVSKPLAEYVVAILFLSDSM